MASLTIRKLDAALKERLRMRASKNGRSMEAEVRAILTEVVEQPPRSPDLNLYDLIRTRFESLGGVDLELPVRQPAREPPVFE